jgi:hypothetical protein
LNAEDFIARKKCSYFFQEQLQSSPTIFVDEESDSLYESDDQLKRKIWRTQLSAARYQISAYGKKLFFGQPDPLLVIEHLSATITIDELKEIFYDCLDEFSETREKQVPCHHPIDLHERLKEMCQWEPVKDF